MDTTEEICKAVRENEDEIMECICALFKRLKHVDLSRTACELDEELKTLADELAKKMEHE